MDLGVHHRVTYRKAQPCGCHTLESLADLQVRWRSVQSLWGRDRSWLMGRKIPKDTHAASICPWFPQAPPPHLLCRPISTMAHWPFSLMFVAWTVLFHTATAACYNPDRSLDPDSRYSANGSTSMCCASYDTSLPNGLCHNTGDGTYTRGTCSTATWDEGHCQTLCTDHASFQSYLASRYSGTAYRRLSQSRSHTDVRE